MRAPGSGAGWAFGRLVPVVRAPEAEGALFAALTLAEAGLPCLEVAFTVPEAAAVIAEVRRETGLPVGAGTVTDARRAEAALAAGAAFLVSPAADPEVAALAREAGVPFVPGALTPTEIVAAARLGASAVKIFPVAAVGGPSYLKLLREPFPELAFLPTGGIRLAEAEAYLAAGAAALGVGGALVDQGAISRRDEAALAALAGAWLEATGPLGRSVVG